MDIARYVKRIGAEGSLEIDKRTLHYLQAQHLLHVPFENIDIYQRRPIALDVQGFYRKIVLQGRGGYCYECNGLFFALLQALGFACRIVSCRIITGTRLSPEFDHMAIIVSLKGQEWLVDVGYGDFSRTPLQLHTGEVQSDGWQHYVIQDYESPEVADALCVSKWNSKKQAFLPEYMFTGTGRELSGFAGMHHFHQTSPESHFTRSLICSKPTEDGRVSLINDKLIITRNGIKKQHRIKGNEAWNELLENYFSLGIAFNYFKEAVSVS